MISHHFKSSQMLLQKSDEGSTRYVATAKNFPALKGMSFYRLILNPLGAREPHWHANADELGFCTKGKVLVSFYQTGNLRDSFLVEAGEMFFIPSGTLHAVENASDALSEVILQFSNENPEDFALSSAFGMFSDAVLGNTWNVPSSKFKNLKRSLKEVFIAKRTSCPTIPKEAYYPSPYKFSLEAQNPLVSNDGGNVKVARQSSWAILSKQALYSLHLSTQGMREPHWHPETAEMGYVNKGRARMSILSPEGSLDTYEINPGDLYFIPKAYPHHIENLSNEPLHLLIFFDQPMPEDIGFSASVKSFDNQLLTAVFNCEENFFSSLPTYYSDRLIVDRVNPLD